jgi:hypothetical protein
MSDYDFQTLNDKEFEILCVDLLWAHLEKRFERFKPGKDAGVDGRISKWGVPKKYFNASIGRIRRLQH